VISVKHSEKLIAKSGGTYVHFDARNDSAAEIRHDGSRLRLLRCMDDHFLLHTATPTALANWLVDLCCQYYGTAEDSDVQNATARGI